MRRREAALREALAPVLIRATLTLIATAPIGGCRIALVLPSVRQRRRYVKMLSRIILAALWLGLVFAAQEADARSSGRGAGRPAISAPRSLQRFHQAPVVNQAARGLHVTPHARRGSFNRRLGYGFPFVFGAPYVYGGDGVVPPTSYAETDSAPPGAPIVVNGRSCFVQPYVVPSEATRTMRTVTVTRCY